jgi:hypothetical protein
MSKPSLETASSLVSQVPPAIILVVYFSRCLSVIINDGQALALQAGIRGLRHRGKSEKDNKEVKKRGSSGWRS